MTFTDVASDYWKDGMANWQHIHLLLGEYNITNMPI